MNNPNNPNNPSSLPLILVDDEETVLLSSQTMLESSGIKPIIILQSGQALLTYLEEHGATAIVLDLMMPQLSGQELLPQLNQQYPQIPVIIMTAVEDLETAVTCMKQGAFDYLIKPVEKSRFLSCIQRALELRRLREEIDTLRKYLFKDTIDGHEAFTHLIARSRKMRAVLQYVEAIAKSPEPVLIMGETGVGKELIAQAIHQVSDVTTPMVSLNVAGLDETAFTDTLFGHKKGAFTGADQNRLGLIAQAEHGTLFLDEIGDLNVTLQLKLLRLLQEKKYFPLGSDIPRGTNARFICATNRDLNDAMKRGTFRADLYFRLSGHMIHIPPLRERKEDITPLVLHFIEEAVQSMGSKSPPLPPELFTLLSNYAFPGNVRELRGLVFDAMALHKSGTLSMTSFQKVILPTNSEKLTPTKPHGGNSFEYFLDPLPTFEEAEAQLLQEALKRCDGNQTMAAAILGTTRQTLHRKIKKLEQEEE